MKNFLCEPVCSCRLVGYTPYVVEILSFGSNMNKAMMTCEFVNGNFNDEVPLNLNFSQETETLVFLVIPLILAMLLRHFCRGVQQY